MVILSKKVIFIGRAVFEDKSTSLMIQTLKHFAFAFATSVFKQSSKKQHLKWSRFRINIK